MAKKKSSRKSRSAKGPRLPKLAVWKFASCDGCQLSLLDCEDELLAVAGAVQIAYFLEASREEIKGPYDLSLVEGSITTPHDVERIQKVRKLSKKVITIGACATTGGIQALRNFSDVEEFTRAVYAHPEYIDTLNESTAIADHIAVDFELRGCPISKPQLLEVLSAFLHGRRPQIENASVCMECKRRGNICTLVTRGDPCLGPITHAGCDALCPTFNRGCFGCYGAQDTSNPRSMLKVLKETGMNDDALNRVFSTFNTADPIFTQARRIHGTQDDQG
jgi:coenzyme F420-reducing hydrogenase gamma subunit